MNPTTGIPIASINPTALPALRIAGGMVLIPWLAVTTVLIVEWLGLWIN